MLPHSPSRTRAEAQANIQYIRDSEAGYLVGKHGMTLEADGDNWSVEFEINGRSQEIVSDDPTTAILQAAALIEAH